MNNKAKFVYSDIGGVLFDEDGTNALGRDFGIELEKFKETRRKYLKSALVGEITANELIKNTFKDMGVDSKVEDFNEYWAANSKPYPIGQKMLINISRFYPVGLLTNNMKDSLGYYRKYGHIPEINYSAIIESAEVGFKKPDEKIYKIAEKESGFSGSEIFFIDDREKNLDGAKKLGWQTFRYDRDNQEESAKEILKLLEINL